MHDRNQVSQIRMGTVCEQNAGHTTRMGHKEKHKKQDSCLYRNLGQGISDLGWLILQLELEF